MSSDPPETPRDPALEELFYRADRIRFVYWRQFSGAKPTVVLTGATTFLAFITGLSNLSRAAPALGGPLAAVLPAAPAYARFGGVLFAFLLGVLTVGLQRRKRVAWYGAVAVLPLLGLVPLVTLQATDLPLLALVAVTVPLLVRNRGGFDQSLDLSSLQVASLLAVGGVLTYGTVGSYALRAQFNSLRTWGDAVYYVLVTIGTVGYGDITPATAEAKWFALSIIVFGTGAFTAAVGALVVPAIESRMAAAFGNMRASELTLLEDHVLVLGYGDVTEPLLEELAGETDVVVVTPDADAASALEAEDINVLTDDPTDEAALRDARIDEARGVVVATWDDASDVLAVLAARNTNPEVRIVAATPHEKHVGKLEELGADEVISPMTIGGKLLGQSVLGESAVDAALDATGDTGDQE
ncbi:MAG: NAD-binding protein [Halobacteriaceae archaeon]